MWYRFLLFLLVLAVRAQAEAVPAQESASWHIERGVLELDFLSEPDSAAAHFRAALVAPDATQRTRAEALWHLAASYANRGSDNMCLQLLQKLLREHPTVESFAQAAAEDAVNLSADLTASGEVYESPNLVDVLCVHDDMRFLCASTKLRAAELAASFARRLLQDVEALVFQLRISPPDESNSDREERELSLGDFAELQDWTHTAQDLIAAGKMDELEKACAEKFFTGMEERTYLEKGDLNVRLYGLRDSLTEALGAASEAKTKAVLTEMEPLWITLTQGPVDLHVVTSLRGEQAALGRIAPLIQAAKWPEALAIWGEARHVFQNGGAGNTGFLWADAEAIPQALLPEIIAALFFVESAIFDLGEEEVAPILQDLTEARTRLAAIKEKCQDEAGQLRLERTLQNLAEAAKKLETGAEAEADSFLRGELYFSP